MKASHLAKGASHKGPRIETVHVECPEQADPWGREQVGGCLGLVWGGVKATGGTGSDC